MIKRKALIIGNPGEQGKENYCNGVNHDLDNYRDFLLSPFGGYWYPTEVNTLLKPSTTTVRNALFEIQKCDYSMIIFSGHGIYSKISNSTLLELNYTDVFDSVNLRKGAEKHTLILDCCRMVDKELFEEMTIIAKALESRAMINPMKFRERFDREIENCSNGIVAMYACAINEKAGDDSQRGGYYSSNLISNAREYCNSSLNFSEILSVVQAHDMTIKSVVEKSNNQQHPQIDKQRSGPYFPFAIKM
jgi:hypothetical protein